MERYRIASLLAATALTVVTASPAGAQSVSELKAMLEKLTKRIEQLEKQQLATPVAVAPVTAADTPVAAKTPVITKAEPAFALGTPDGRFEFNIRGRILADAGFISDSDDTVDIRATEFRAARLGIEGKAWKSVKYKFEADFSGNEVDLKDAYLEYASSYGKWKFGQFKTANSLDEQTSSRHITFLERASFTDAFGLSRNLGISYGNGGDNWTLNAGAFRGGNGVSEEDEGEIFAARVTYGGEIDGGVWMLGASARYRDIGDGSLIRYRQRPHHHLSSRFIATDRIASNDSFYGFEGAIQYGAFHAASEWGFLTADEGGAGGRDANFHGGYFEAGWFLTGESKPLKLDKGAWDRPKVNSPLQDGGFGALQVAARFDRIDLTADGVYGGEQDTYIIGLNWYLNRHTRFTANYSHSSIDKAFNVAANGPDGENGVDALGLRFQVDW